MNKIEQFMAEWEAILDLFEANPEDAQAMQQLLDLQQRVYDTFKNAQQEGDNTKPFVPLLEEIQDEKAQRFHLIEEDNNVPYEEYDFDFEEANDFMFPDGEDED